MYNFYVVHFRIWTPPSFSNPTATSFPRNPAVLAFAIIFCFATAKVFKSKRNTSFSVIETSWVLLSFTTTFKTDPEWVSYRALASQVVVSIIKMCPFSSPITTWVSSSSVMLWIPDFFVKVWITSPDSSYATNFPSRSAVMNLLSAVLITESKPD